MYQHKGPPVSVLEKDGGQRRRGGAGRPHGSVEPGPPPVQVHFGGNITLILLKEVDDVSLFILVGTNLKEL